MCDGAGSSTRNCPQQNVPCRRRVWEAASESHQLHKESVTLSLSLRVGLEASVGVG